MESGSAVAILSLILITTTGHCPATAQAASSREPLWQITATEPNKNPPHQVPLHTIAKGVRSGIREPAQFVIRSQGEWQKLWRQHTSTGTVPAPLPTVDFNKELVAAVFLGEKPTGGYSVEISSAELSDTSLIISVKETSPGPGAIVTQGFNQPFHIVRIETAGVETVSFRRAP
jgi:hypothetical protein